MANKGLDYQRFMDAKRRRAYEQLNAALTPLRMPALPPANIRQPSGPRRPIAAGGLFPNNAPNAEPEKKPWYQNVLEWGPLKNTLNALSTPGAFVTGALTEVAERGIGNLDQSGFTPQEREILRQKVQKDKEENDSIISAAIENVRRQWSGEDVNYGQDFLRTVMDPADRDKGEKNLAYGVGGFLVDVALDPLNLIGSGAVGAAGKALGRTRPGIAARHAINPVTERVGNAARQAVRKSAQASDNEFQFVANMGRQLLKKPVIPGKQTRAIREAAAARTAREVNEEIATTAPAAAKVESLDIPTTPKPTAEGVLVAPKVADEVLPDKMDVKSALEEIAPPTKKPVVEVPTKRKPVAIPEIFRETQPIDYDDFDAQIKAVENIFGNADVTPASVSGSGSVTEAVEAAPDAYVNYARLGDGDELVHKNWEKFVSEDLPNASGGINISARADQPVRVSAKELADLLSGQMSRRDIDTLRRSAGYNNNEAFLDSVRTTAEEIFQRRYKAPAFKYVDDFDPEEIAAARAAEQATPSTATGEAPTRSPETRQDAEWVPALRNPAIMQSMEIVSPSTWKKIQQRLRYYENKKLITREEYDGLVAAYKTQDPQLWEQVRKEIMFDGHPSGIDVPLRETVANADEIPAAPVIEGDPLKSLDPDIEAKTRDIIKEVVGEEFIKKLETHNISTRSGARLTSTDADRVGRFFEGFGRYNQYSLIRRIMNPKGKFARLNSEIQKSGKFAQQGRARYDTFMPILKAANEWLEANGIVANLGTGVRGIPLNSYDVLASLNRSDVINMVFQPSKDIPITNILEAADYVIRSHPFYRGANLIPDEQAVDAIAAILKQRPGALAGGTNKFSGLGKYAPSSATKAKRLEIANNNRKVKFQTFDDLVDYEARRYAQAIWDRRNDLFDAAAQKAKRYHMEIGAQTTAIHEDIVTNVLEVVADPNAPFATVVNSLENLDDAIDASAAANKAHPEAAIRATDDIEKSAADIVPEEKVQAAEEAVKQRDAVSDNPGPDNKALKETSDNAVAQAQEDLTAARVDDWEANLDAAIPSRIQQRYGRFAKAFQRNYKMPDVGPAIYRYRTILRPMRADYRRLLNRTSKKWGAVTVGETNAFDAAFDALRKGVPANEIPNELVRQAADEVHDLVDFFFATDRGVLNNETLNRFILNGFDLDIVNAGYAAQGMPGISFDLDAARKAVKRGDFENLGQALGAQWRTWDIDDPAHFLSVSEHVLNQVATHDATIRQGIYMAEQLGVVSTKPKPGYVRYSPPAGLEKSEVSAYWPRDTYIDKDILPQFQRMDEVLNESLLPNSDLGKFVSRNITPIMQMWKTGMTIWNPRHWFRNGIGDISLNYLAGVKNPKSYATALRIMHHKGDYGMWDGLTAMQTLGLREIKPGATVMTSKRFGGGKLEWTADEIYQGLRDRGTLVSFPIRENLTEEMVDLDRLARMQQSMAITGGRAKELVTKTHEWRDHHIRLAHAVDVLRKGRFRNKEQALDEVAKIVRKWHPDGSDLTHFENKYMRFVFPFYSWTRRALPLIVEAMLSNPHRVMTYPRAYYNFAESMGVDLTSTSDPFPEDQLFPSWMTDERITGPLMRDEEGNYIGYRPGVVQDDLSGFLNDPIGEALNMLSPAIAIPAELLTGAQVGGFGEIKDMSDYVDQNIPFVNVAAGVTGVSPTGTLARALPGGEPGILDPTRNATRGLRQSLAGDGYEIEQGINERELLNWLTGVQKTNMSQANYIRQAQLEARDRALEEWRRQQNAG